MHSGPTSRSQDPPTNLGQCSTNFRQKNQLIQGSDTQGNDLCNLSGNGALLFVRQVAGMVLQCAMILATCSAIATAKGSRESLEHFNRLMSANCCETSCKSHCKDCYTTCRLCCIWTNCFNLTGFV